MDAYPKALPFALLMISFAMATSMENADWRLLGYFYIAAEEGSLRGAAQRLYMTEPPLSRQIKRLEETLGVRLFERHSKGLTLTESGRRVLDIIRPVLEAQKIASRQLQLLRHEESPLVLGLTTAFEQSIFTQLTTRLEEDTGVRLRLVRRASPDLARMVRRGTLTAALVALPLDAPGLVTWPLPHEEAMFAVLPASWPEAHASEAVLKKLSGRPLFWFQREVHPAFYDYAKGVFAYAGFLPIFLEEPAEYDVLLSSIAQGEGMALLPESFAVIERKNVVFVPLAKDEPLRLKLGLVTREDGAGNEAIAMRNAALVERICAVFADGMS